MAEYLIIESRDPFECNDVRATYELAAGLAQAGNTVTVFLVQNGVLPARKSRVSEMLSALAESGVEVLADALSLRERGIDTARLAPGVREAPLDTVVDHLAAGRKALFH